MRFTQLLATSEPLEVVRQLIIAQHNVVGNQVGRARAAWRRRLRASPPAQAAARPARPCASAAQGLRLFLGAECTPENEFKPEDFTMSLEELKIAGSAPSLARPLHAKRRPRSRAGRGDAGFVFAAAAGRAADPRPRRRWIGE